MEGLFFHFLRKLLYNEHYGLDEILLISLPILLDYL
jgi:hypothetical protein